MKFKEFIVKLLITIVLGLVYVFVVSIFNNDNPFIGDGFIPDFLMVIILVGIIVLIVRVWKYL